ncbi:FBP domain-containing protein [Microbacterium kribbense]|uniref:FBP domain-containing protein n=1 Tax=Microbacterium kribbense TaxID=433645 RepID=A0ABP7GNH2_9MICO
MHAPTENDIRTSFVNASVRERSSLSLPDGFAALDWDTVDFFAWRDPKLAPQGYLVVPLDGALTGVLLREHDRRPTARAQCAWCEDVTLPNDVVFYSAKRAGRAGRNGNTVGTLACAGFECSRNARKLPPLAYPGFDRAAARDRRIAALQANVAAFARDIRDSD